jgi:CRP-like cAMP-binding protein
VWRLPAERFETLIAADSALALPLHRQLAEQHARTLLHVAAIGSLSGEERVASFLIELALRIGKRTTLGVAFDVPLSRTDIADYLELNADTLSRIMSRLRVKGVVAQTGRCRAVLPDWEGLCALSPVLGAIMALHGKAKGDALVP